ncbi:hypothetical protein [Candidatus Electronema sp. JM]|uniref:hypothetical protein n=1 Tax=Candidatus Electronema sp. JM TaxID=3401571 RepID=UPI003AA8C166
MSIDEFHQEELQQEKLEIQKREIAIVLLKQGIALDVIEKATGLSAYELNGLRK